ncbi:Dabb family protein [Streptosporangium sp. NPDC023615]|uniref:Dabb family protein n=1 Tax=Streptosporangium sp. NPDC023615 TaxID=3154794 RepID=UPI00342EC8E9
MIFHVNRLTFRPEVDDRQRAEALDRLRLQGSEIDAVTSWVVGPDIGGDYEWGAVFAIEDLEGYWEYLVHPVHFESQKAGLPLIGRFVSFDITDDDDPGIGARIAELHERSYRENPELATLVGDVPSFAAGAVPEDEPRS